MTDTVQLNVTTALLVKLGSLAVHVEELLGPDGHGVDAVAIEQLLNNAEVKEWLASMDQLGFLPKKRSQR